MTTLNDIQNAVNSTKEAYSLLQGYENKVIEVENEIEELKAKPNDFDSVILLKQKESYLPEVKRAYQKLVREKFPSIRVQAHNIPVQAYMTEKIDNDPELKTLKEAYIKAQHELINSAVAYNKTIKAKKIEYANEVLTTGYDELVEELNSNTEGASYGGGYVSDYANNYDVQYKLLSVPAEYTRAYNAVMEDNK